jgi:hypothetical protein
MQGLLAAYRRLKERFDHLVAEYGRLALYTYFGMFGVVLLGFFMAMQLGFHASEGTGLWATLGAAWVATKVTQPVRILATLAATPVVARWVGRR